MRATQSVSFWILIFSAIIGLLVGQIHWLLGVFVFVVLAGKAAIFGLILDTISGSLEYHHDRQDARMKKTMESIKYLTEQHTVSRTVSNTASLKNLIIRR